LKFLTKYTDQAYALLRIVSGFMFSFHGAQKIFGILGESRQAFFSLLWFAGLIELVCGLMIMLGFKNRWAAFIASGEMAVAYFHFHWQYQFNSAIFPAINHGELAALYSFVFLYIACPGSVIWCLEK
jgi:putative oxidoreductase